MNYTYDSVGNRLKMTKTLFNQKESKQLKKEETSYTYNGLDQMLTSNVTETSGSSSTNTSAVTYTYDANGNLVATTDSVKQEEATYQYDPQGQMISYEAKKDGKVVATQKNAYNGNGQRILKKDGSKKEESYYYQDGTLLLTLSDSALKDFYYLGNAGNPLAVTSNTSDGLKCYTYQKDVQGSTRAVTDSNGQCVKWYEYTDFGETTVHEEQASFDNELCYTGGVYDENTGLYYNPETGRFISRDTYEGTSEEPSSLHLYLYCANDPVNYVDPSGHRQIAVIYYTGSNGFYDQAHRSTEYSNENVDFYPIRQKDGLKNIWARIERKSSTKLYIYLHGGSKVLYFSDKGKITSSELDSLLSSNKQLKKVYLYSCKGAEGGKQSISYILWKKTKAKVYASKVGVSFRPAMFGKTKTSYSKAYCDSKKIGKLGLVYKLMNPVQLQKYK